MVGAEGCVGTASRRLMPLWEDGPIWERRAGQNSGLLPTEKRDPVLQEGERLLFPKAAGKAPE